MKISLHDAIYFIALLSACQLAHSKVVRLGGLAPARPIIFIYTHHNSRIILPERVPLNTSNGLWCQNMLGLMLHTFLAKEVPADYKL